MRVRRLPLGDAAEHGRDSVLMGFVDSMARKYGFSIFCSRSSVMEREARLSWPAWECRPERGEYSEQDE